MWLGSRACWRGAQSGGQPPPTHHAAAARLVVRAAHEADFLDLAIGCEHGHQVLLRAGGGHLAHEEARHACGGDMRTQRYRGGAYRRPGVRGGPVGCFNQLTAQVQFCMAAASPTNCGWGHNDVQGRNASGLQPPPTRRRRAGPWQHQPYHRPLGPPEPPQAPDRASHLPQPAARGSGRRLEALLQAAA